MSVSVLLSLLEREIKNGQVVDLESISHDERFVFRETSKKHSFVELKGTATFGAKSYKIVYKVMSYSRSTGQMFGYLQNIDTPEFSEHGYIYVDDPIYAFEMA